MGKNRFTLRSRPGLGTNALTAVKDRNSVLMIPTTATPSDMGLPLPADVRTEQKIRPGTAGDSRTLTKPSHYGIHVVMRYAKKKLDSVR